MNSNSTPSPAAKKSASSKIVKYGCLPIIGITVLFTVLGLLTDDKAATPAGNATETTAQKIAETPETAPANWNYSDTADKMGKSRKVATTVSDDILEFEFPYNGGSTSTLIIQKKNGPTDIIYQIAPGQILTDHSVKVKFDDRAPYTVGVNQAADLSSDIVFLQSASKILSDIKRSKKMVVEVDFYQGGSRQVEFNVEGLDWK